MSSAPVFASASEALDMVHAGLAFLASADATSMGAGERARCLRGLEEADSVATAARTSVLGAFGAGQDYVEDGDYSPRSWLAHRTQVTGSTAGEHTGWVKRGAEHPAVMAALGTREVSKSYAREICRWTDKLPEDAQTAADEILLAAAASGLELEDLARLAAEMYEKSRQDKPDGDGDGENGDGPGAALDDRAVKLATTIGGAGVIRGDLTPECAEFVQTVLDALSAPASADDDRSHEQRYHDALQEAMRRLLAADLLPERSGQPVKAWAYISLADLMRLEGSSALLAEWTQNLRARWAGHRAAAAFGGARSREALEQAVIGKAVELLSGPGGLASFLRRKLLEDRLTGPSVPLDIGYSSTVPAGIRNAVRHRALHCEWAGRCSQPASACQVHHTTHKANGGKTSLRTCVLLCAYHHQVMIHRLGWTLVVNPDGTTTAWNKDRTKVLHSHGPPARAG